MPNKIKLELKDLKVNSFKTTGDETAFKGGVADTGLSDCRSCRRTKYYTCGNDCSRGGQCSKAC